MTTKTTTTLRLTDPAVRQHLEALPASQVLIGLADDGQPVCIDLDSDGPHVLVCSGTAAPGGAVRGRRCRPGSAGSLLGHDPGEGRPQEVPGRRRPR